MVKITEIDDRLLPSEEDVQRYEELGYHITPEIVPHDLLDAVRGSVDGYQSGSRDRSLSADEAKFSDWKPGDKELVRNNEFCSLQNDVVRSLVMTPLIGAIAARLARSEGARLFDDQLIFKPPAAGEEAKETVVGWHTDGSYWSTCTSNSMLTAWIPLHDVSEENGTLCVVAGSHRWDESEHVRGFNNTDFNALEGMVGRKVSDDLIHPINLKKGQMSFHHMRALHGSMPNVSDGPRCAVALHMQNAENSYQPFYTPDGTLIVLPHDKLCRKGENGHPDYSDPAVFPQLWPAVA